MENRAILDTTNVQKGGPITKIDAVFLAIHK